MAVEFDGQVKYTDPWRGRTPERVLWEEKRREDELRALDIRVVRIVDADLVGGWPATEGRLRTLLASPGPATPHVHRDAAAGRTPSDRLTPGPRSTSRAQGAAPCTTSLG